MLDGSIACALLFLVFFLSLAARLQTVRAENILAGLLALVGVIHGVLLLLGVITPLEGRAGYMWLFCGLFLKVITAGYRRTQPPL